MVVEGPSLPIPRWGRLGRGRWRVWVAGAPCDLHDKEVLEARVVDHEAGLRRVVGLLYKKALGEELGNLSNLY